MGFSRRQDVVGIVESGLAGDIYEGGLQDRELRELATKRCAVAFAFLSRRVHGHLLEAMGLPLGRLNLPDSLSISDCRLSVRF